MTTLSLLRLLQDAPSPSSGNFMNGPLMPLLLVGVLFFFLLILPERKKQKQRQAMLDAIKKGDRVMTTSGIYGTVVTTTSEIAVLQVSDNVRMRFARAAIQSVIEPEKDGAAEKSADKNEDKAEPSKA
jgi:preprotein translocase subunit YajC